MQFFNTSVADRFVQTYGSERGRRFLARLETFLAIVWTSDDIECPWIPPPEIVLYLDLALSVRPEPFQEQYASRVIYQPRPGGRRFIGWKFVDLTFGEATVTQAVLQRHHFRIREQLCYAVPLMHFQFVRSAQPPL